MDRSNGDYGDRPVKLELQTKLALMASIIYAGVNSSVDEAVDLAIKIETACFDHVQKQRKQRRTELTER